MGGHDIWDLLLRWFHVIAGIMWIGNSMLFNWLDRNLEKVADAAAKPRSQGVIWMVHSGAFYEVEKKLLGPNEMPAILHWFKWQNFLTWASGISLLVVLYYIDTSIYLIDPRVMALTSQQAIGASAGLIVGSWLIYDLNWRLLGKVRILPHAITAALVVAVIYAACHLFSGRAAFIHVGVVLGTIMTGNVWTVILPSQKGLIAATRSGQPQDESLSLKAKHRSIHNNYFTFPLIFIMVSNHFSAVFDGPSNWLALLVLTAGGAAIRHLMNIRYGFSKTVSPGMRALAWLFPAGTIIVLSIALLVNLTTRVPGAAAASGSSAVSALPATFANVNALIGERCRACHSESPTDPAWPVAPNGVKFDTPEEIQRMAPRIKVRAVELQTMPLTNKTGMSDAERELLGRWIDQGAKLD